MIGAEDERDQGEIAPEELAFADEDERLPWLESGEYDDDETGVDTGRIFGFALAGLLVIAALVAGIWWFSHRGPDPRLVADGSTIHAPPGPYKQRPANPGGKQFEGTGDIAPAVGQGETREGRIAEEPAPQPAIPKPSVDARKTGEPPEPAQAGGTAVQVGAYSSRETAEAGWQKLLRQTDVLQGVSHRVVQGQADIGTVFRLQAMAGDRAAANTLCRNLKANGVACQVK
ncbi:MAG: SPOR domain-containing protein [Tsuneonella sp.]